MHVHVIQAVMAAIQAAHVTTVQEVLTAAKENVSADTAAQNIAEARVIHQQILKMVVNVLVKHGAAVHVITDVLQDVTVIRVAVLRVIVQLVVQVMEKHGAADLVIADVQRDVMEVHAVVLQEPVKLAVQVMAEHGAAAHVIPAAEAVVEAVGVRQLVTAVHVVQARMIHQHVVKLYTETEQNIAEVHVIPVQTVQTDVIVIMNNHIIADAVQAEQIHLLPAVQV